MKNIKIYIAALFVLLVTGRCKEMNPFEGVNMVVSDGKVNSPVLLQFTDANSESEITPDKITVKITGDKSAYILNSDGKKNYTPAGNILTLKLAQGIVASPSAPVKFTVEAAAPGYLTTSRDFTLTSTDPVQFVMPLVNLKSPPPGVTYVQTNVSTSGGKISFFNTSPSTGVTSNVGASLRQATVNMTSDSEVGSVVFKTGTQVMDASGNVIPTDNVNADIVMWNLSRGELAYFPGGLTQENVLLSSGEGRKIRFTSLGLARIRMSAGGKDVNKFSKPLEVTMTVSPDIQNPQTREPVKEGSTIPTWSLDESTYKWKQEGVAVVSKNSKGDLEAKFEVSHLSYWSISYFTEFKNTCPGFTGTLPTYFKVNSNVNYNPGGYYAILFDEKGNKVGTDPFYGFLPFDIANGSAFNNYVDYGYLNINEGDRLKLKVVDRPYDDGLGKIVGEADFTVNFSCTSQTIPIQITLSNPPKPVVLDLNLTAICERKGVHYKPSGWISLNPGDPRSASSHFFYFENGGFNVSTYVHETEYTGIVVYGSTSARFRALFARGGNGATILYNDAKVNDIRPSYNAAQDKIILAADIVLSDCN